jgi:hypothetical protein
MMQLNDPKTKAEVDRMLADPTFRRQLEKMKNDPSYRDTIDGTKAALADSAVNSDGDTISDAQLGMSELAKAAKDPKLMAEAMNMMKDPGTSWLFLSSPQLTRGHAPHLPATFFLRPSRPPRPRGGSRSS